MVTEPRTEVLNALVAENPVAAKILSAVTKDGVAYFTMDDSATSRGMMKKLSAAIDGTPWQLTRLIKPEGAKKNDRCSGRWMLFDTSEKDAVQLVEKVRDVKIGFAGVLQVRVSGYKKADLVKVAREVAQVLTGDLQAGDLSSIQCRTHIESVGITDYAKVLKPKPEPEEVETIPEKDAVDKADEEEAMAKEVEEEEKVMHEIEEGKLAKVKEEKK